MRFLLLFLLLFLSLAYGDKHLEKVSLQLHWKYQFQFAGFIVAKEKGYYEEVGLDVELKEYEFGTDIIDEVLSSHATYGIYNSNILLEYLGDSSIKLISSYFKRSALVLITSPEITSVKELVGKRVMAGTKDDFELNFRPLLDEYDVETKDLKLIKHTYSIEDFANKKVDAMTAFISDQPYKLDKLGIKYNIINPSDYGAFNLQLELFTSNEEIINHPQRVKNFKDATIRGWKYALAHQDEIVKLIHEKYSKDISKEALTNEAREIQRLILPKTYKIGSVDKNFLSRQFDMFKRVYKINDEIILDDFIYEEPDKVDSFTKEELAFLEKNKNINLCLHPKVYPIDGFVDGKHTGITGDIFTEISNKTGLVFNPIISRSYKEFFSKVKEKECEVVSIISKKSILNEQLKISEPFFHTYFTLVSKVDKSFIQDPYELKDKKIVVQSKIYKEIILKYYPYLNIEIQKDSDKMINKLLNDEVFAIAVVNEVSDYVVDKYGYGKLKINGFLSKENLIHAGVGVLKHKPLLGSIIEKSLKDISQDRIDTIVKNWRVTRYHKATNYKMLYRVLFIVSILLLVMLYYQRKLKRTNSELAKKVEELSQKDKILTQQSKQAVMGEMISMIAHQWRQPLSMITLKISNLQIQKMMGSKISEDMHDEVLSEISDSIIYLSETIDDFKTYFHPDKKTTTIELHDLLEKVVKFALPRVEGSKITLEVLKSKKINLKTYTNELVQVVLNIVNNAIDAFDGVKKDDKFIKLYMRKSKNILSIYIEDNASGIPEENLEKLFEPYFSTKGKNGTGLGLYMSKMILQKQFGGDIKVQTSQSGTTFIIEMVV